MNHPIAQRAAPAAREKKLKYKKDYLEAAVLYLFLTIVALIFIVPFLWLVSSSFKTNTEIFAHPPTWIPRNPTLENYVRGFTEFPFLRYLGNTVFLILMNTIGSVVSNTLVAYGFAKVKWPGRNVVFYIVLLTMILPFQVTMVPLFLLFQRLGWIGTFLPLIVPTFFGNAFFIFLLRQFFIGIPGEISESAKVDGANEFVIYSRFILPLAKPGIISVVIFTFINTWGDFIGPLIFLSDNKLYTLSIGVQQLMSAFDPRWPLLMAVGTAMTAPVLVLFFLMQRFFIQGISFSGIKG